MAIDHDNHDYSTARLKHFEQWRHSEKTDHPILQCFTISRRADQRYLQTSLHREAQRAQVTNQDVIANARLPFRDSVEDHQGFTSLYIMRNAFELGQKNVTWILDGSRHSRRVLRCSVGSFDELLRKLEMLELIKPVDIEEKPWMLWKVFKRLEFWLTEQKFEAGIE